MSCFERMQVYSDTHILSEGVKRHEEPNDSYR